MGSLLTPLEIGSALFAVGCSQILEPLEQRFLFRPRISDPAYLAAVASPANGLEEIHLKTGASVTLHGWLKRPAAAHSGQRFPLVIVFGGVRRETSWLIDRGAKPERWTWLFINYRGFGLSEGVPSERAVREDAGLIYDYAATRPDVDPSNIVVLGRSLGSYFAAALATTRHVRGAVLATPLIASPPSGRGVIPGFRWGYCSMALRCGCYRARDQGARAVRPRRARRCHSGRERRSARARMGRPPTHPEAGGRASLRDRAARRVLEGGGGVPTRSRIHAAAPERVRGQSGRRS